MKMKCSTVTRFKLDVFISIIEDELQDILAIGSNYPDKEKEISNDDLNRLSEFVCGIRQTADLFQNKLAQS